MDNRNRNRKSNSGKGAVVAPAILALLYISNLVAGSSDGSLLLLLIICVIVGIVIFVVSMVKKSGKGEKAVNKTAKLPRLRNEKDLEVRPMSPSVKKSPAVYNERSAEELFRHDHEERMQQLEVFLKNGIIDKKEYAILKERYEKISYERN